MATVIEVVVKYTTKEGYTRVVYSRYVKGIYNKELCFDTDDERREMVLFEPINLKY